MLLSRHYEAMALHWLYAENSSVSIYNLPWWFCLPSLYKESSTSRASFSGSLACREEKHTIPFLAILKRETILSLFHTFSYIPTVLAHIPDIHQQPPGSRLLLFSTMLFSLLKQKLFFLIWLLLGFDNIIPSQLTWSLHTFILHVIFLSTSTKISISCNWKIEPLPTVDSQDMFCM